MSYKSVPMRWGKMWVQLSSRFALGEFLHRIAEVAIGHDNVPLQHGLGLVPGQPHCNLLANARPNQCPDRRSAEVMNQLTRTPGLPASALPGLLKSPDRLPLAAPEHKGHNLPEATL